MWLLQRLAVGTRSWWPVVTSNLASGALGRVVPGGAAAAGALQYRMLAQAGVPGSLAGLGIGVASIVVVATLAALPVLALPAIVLGVAVPARLWQAMMVGLGLFVALLAVGATLMASDRAVEWVGRAIVRVGRRRAAEASRRRRTSPSACATSATSCGARSASAGGRRSRAPRDAGSSTG